MKKLFKPVLDFLESVLSVKEIKKKYSDLILINEEGEILLLLRSNTDSFCPGQWSLPGGSVEEGEHPSISALRELKEETGIELNVDDIQFYKEIDRGNNISYYFIGSVSSSDVEIILNANEHQGYEWVSPNNIWQKDCLMDLNKFLAESFNINSDSEKYVDHLANYSTEDQINEAVDILNKSFDNGEINEDIYLDKINLLGIIKSEYDKSIIIGKNNDPEYTIRIKKADINNELDSNYQNYLDNAYYYNDKLYDENGIGIPMTSEDIQNIIKQNKNIYQVDCYKLDSFVSGSKVFEDTKRYNFEKVLPTIKKYNDYYNKYENELLDSFASSINDYQNRRSEIKKTIKSTIGDGLSDSKNIIKLLNFIKSNLNDEIDPLFNIRYQYDSDNVNKRQIFLSELEKFLNDGGFINLISLEIVGIDSYDDGEFRIDYPDVNDIKNISIIHNKVINKIKPLIDLKLELDDKLNKGEITDEEFLSYIIKADDASHGGKLVKKQIIDKTGRKQTKWVSKNSEEEKKEVKNEYTDDELINHAKNSSLADLERVIKESPDAKLREIAHFEINRREKEEHINDDSDSNNKSTENSNEDDTDNKKEPEIKKSTDIDLIKGGKAEILKGCLMFYPKINKDKWKDTVESLIPVEIVQEYEYDPHITILYGFDDQVIDIERLKYIVNSFVEANPIEIKLDKVSIFSNENDVIKIGIIDVNGNLTKLNEHIRFNFKYESNFPDYSPHMTLAYVNKGEGNKFIGKHVDLDDFGFITLNSGRYIYSNANKQKTEIRPLINEYLSFNKADDNDIEKGKKPYPVGYINHDGFEKQADGKWKYVGKKKLISLGFELQENGKWKKNDGGGNHTNGIKLTPSKKGVSSGTINYKDDSAYIKVGDDKWVRLNDFINSWNGKIPAEIKSQLKLHYNLENKVSSSMFDSLQKLINLKDDDIKNEDVRPTNNKKSKAEIKGQQLVSEFHSLLNEQDRIEFFETKFNEFDAETFEYFCDNAELFVDNLKSYLYSESYKYSDNISTTNIGWDIRSFASSINSAFNRSFEPKKMEHADYSNCKVSQMRFINAYTYSAYKLVNRFKSGSYNVEFSEALKKYINLFADIVDRGLNNITNNKEREFVYRTLNPQTKAVEKTKKKLIDYMMNIGNNVNYGTILSTSISPHAAFSPDSDPNNRNHIVYKIANPKSAKLIKDISYHPGEQEAIFPTTTKFEITDVRVSKDRVDEFGISANNLVYLKEVD